MKYIPWYVKLTFNQSLQARLQKVAGLAGVTVSTWCRAVVIRALNEVEKRP